MAGIYIHIPFCKQACHYCNFHFSTSLRYKDALIEAIRQEIEKRKDYLETKQIDTIYFGGGTPSLLSKQDLGKIMDSLSKHFTWANEAEITLEANPDDINPNSLKDFKSLGINRLSIGIQSFFDEDLTYMNRAHTANEAEICVKLAQDIGFENISIDLIYGSPTTTNEHWQQNLDRAIAMNISHISSYCLTVEPNTPLQKMIKKGQSSLPNSDTGAHQFDMLMLSLQRSGYEHYEISNFAKDKNYAVHNTNYWRGKSYLGLGPAAHSYNTLDRASNIANNNIYIKAMNEGLNALTYDNLTPRDRYNETIMTGLRTMWGVNISDIQNIDASYVYQLANDIKRYLDSDEIRLLDNHYIITHRAKHFADRIAMELFIIE